MRYRRSWFNIHLFWLIRIRHKPILWSYWLKIRNRIFVEKQVYVFLSEVINTLIILIGLRIILSDSHWLWSFFYYMQGLFPLVKYLDLFICFFNCHLFDVIKHALDFERIIHIILNRKNFFSSRFHNDCLLSRIRNLLLGFLYLLFCIRILLLGLLLPQFSFFLLLLLYGLCFVWTYLLL